jgi:hypothetical protein
VWRAAVILRATWPAQPQATQPQDALEMGEQHLDAFAVAARLLESFGVNEWTGGIASVFVDAARDFALGRLWAAFWLQRARATIIGPRALEESLAIVDPACRVQKLALRAYIDVAIFVEREVVSAQRAVFALGFVDDRNVRSNLLLVDDPVERRRRPIGRVRCSRRQTGLSSSTQSLECGSRHGDPCRGANAERDPMPPTTSADDTLIAAHLASGILAATMRVASVENPAAQAPLAAKLYFDCHDALRAERKRRYEV